MTAIATVAAALAVGLLVPPPVRWRTRTGTREVRRRSRHWWVLPVLVSVAAAALIAGPRGAGWVIVVAVVAGTVSWLLQHAAIRRQRDRGRREVARASAVLAGQLRVGQVPVRALAVAAEECRVLERAVATQRIGGDVGSTMRDVALGPGRHGLLALAEAWELSERTGAPVARTAQLVADELREDERTRAVTGAELATARATGRLLAALPVAGLVVAHLAGADPVRLFTRTGWGQYVAALGAVLACSGVVWMELIADRAQDRNP